MRCRQIGPLAAGDAQPKVQFAASENILLPNPVRARNRILGNFLFVELCVLLNSIFVKVSVAATVWHLPLLVGATFPSIWQRSVGLQLIHRFN